MLSRLIRAAGATIVALATLIAAPAFANNKTVNGITVETTLTQITRGQSYSYQIAPTGPGAYAGTYSFSLIGGALPAGITVSSSGLVSGMTCDSNGNNKFDVRVSTNGAPATTADFSGNSNGMTVNVTTSGSTGLCALTLTGTTPNGTVGTAYSGASFSPSGGTSPYSYSLFSGALPPGLTLASNGTISGTPTTAGTYTFVVNATDAILRAGQATFSITIAPAVPVTLNVNPTSLPGGTTTVAYSQSFSVSNGTAPYTYAISSGTVPTGLALASGTLSGTPTVAGS